MHPRPKEPQEVDPHRPPPLQTVQQRSRGSTWWCKLTNRRRKNNPYFPRCLAVSYLLLPFEGDRKRHAASVMFALRVTKELVASKPLPARFFTVHLRNAFAIVQVVVTLDTRVITAVFSAAHAGCQIEHLSSDQRRHCPCRGVGLAAFD